MKKFVFVSGCPRSGTTVLGQIMNWSDDCFIGLERFGMLFERNPKAFTPYLFETARFQSHLVGDCPHRALVDNGEYTAWYANAEKLKSLDAMTHIGDKIVTLWTRFEAFDTEDWRDRDVTILHIIRNVVDVAASYQRRHDDPNDGWSDDLENGIVNWCKSVECTHAFLSQRAFSSGKHSLKIISYEKLMSDNLETFTSGVMKLYDACGVTFSDNTRGGMQKILTAGEHRSQVRGDNTRLREKILALVPGSVIGKQVELERLSVV